ncbi:hypothetical protein BC829DRAFT_89498 [Chytridium lagenaria]|nr:hypothetical protein BC829DRAFT_89498 [Chytridium lagenaria]
MRSPPLPMQPSTPSHGGIGGAPRRGFVDLDDAEVVGATPSNNPPYLEILGRTSNPSSARSPFPPPPPQAHLLCFGRKNNRMRLASTAQSEIFGKRFHRSLVKAPSLPTSMLRCKHPAKHTPSLTLQVPPSPLPPQHPPQPTNPPNDLATPFLIPRRSSLNQPSR